MLVRLPAAGANEILALARQAEELADVAVAIPGLESVLLLFDRAESVPSLENVVRALTGPARASAEVEPRRHRVEVSFADEDAPDLPRLLQSAGLSKDTFLAAVAELRLSARFLGFRPGFAYLEGIPPEWALPRRATSRPRVPGGSLGIAGVMAGFYPETSPGGWNLIGRTGESFWDPSSHPPNRIAPGDEVRIVPVESVREMEPRRSLPPHQGEPIAEVMRPATGMMIVPPADLGRTAWGLPAGGPFDPGAARKANRNLGNREDEATIECALSGPSLRFRSAALVSWCGAGTIAKLDGHQIDEKRVIAVHAGSELDFVMVTGARGYLAIAGGWGGAERFRLPAPIQRGFMLTRLHGEVSPARIRALERSTPSDIVAMVGPDPVDREWSRILTESEWEVTPQSDRSGIRFRSSRRAEGIPASLPSSGMLFGTVQWHPDGTLVAMGPDHPVTGGYLQPMTILSNERWKLGQLRPGDRIRWRLIHPPQTLSRRILREP